MNEQAGVVMDVRVGEELTIDLSGVTGALGVVTVKVERKDGQRARLRVVADKRILVSRPHQQRMLARPL